MGYSIGYIGVIKYYFRYKIYVIFKCYYVYDGFVIVDISIYIWMNIVFSKLVIGSMMGWVSFGYNYLMFGLV